MAQLNHLLIFFDHLKKGSLVQIYNKLSELRDEPSLSWGDVNFNTTDNQVVSFVREATGFDRYLIAANTGDEEKSVDFHAKHNVPNIGKLVFLHSPENLVQSGDFKVGEELSVENVSLQPGQLLVAKFVRLD